MLAAFPLHNPQHAFKVLERLCIAPSMDWTACLGLLARGCVQMVVFGRESGPKLHFFAALI